jgi:hypothetical protein
LRLRTRTHMSGGAESSQQNVSATGWHCNGESHYRP